MSETVLFAREFLRSPLQTASLIPSSARLVERLIAAVPERGEPVVVELGPGTGPATEAIQRKLTGRGRHIAIELNGRLAAHLVQRFPRADIVTDSAWELPRILADRGLRTADVVVSSLPWSAFTGPHGHTLIAKIASILPESGVYTQFTYTFTRWAPPSRHRLAQLHGAFEEVVASRTVYRNLPPALVYSARRPRFPAVQPLSSSVPAAN
ncbi:class I SAM-dependent methyltransferase [Nocardia amamiensis]|uniref:class I SAM-dependent methyltransferase n=1 Tax=Nocardia amamiensis TaxID=404578 RepID=UPI00082C30E5|nr:SAM-dependent methyltransferase [Nocardia amamiensis]